MLVIDASLSKSEDGDATAEFEAEYDLRITQRLVLQPWAELTFAAQDIPERDLGAGITGAVADLRLRYEIKREFAPYISVQYQTLVGETDNIAQAAGSDTERLFSWRGSGLPFDLLVSPRKARRNRNRGSSGLDRLAPHSCAHT